MSAPSAARERDLTKHAGQDVTLGDEYGDATGYYLLIRSKMLNTLLTVLLTAI